MVGCNFKYSSQEGPQLAADFGAKLPKEVREQVMLTWKSPEEQSEERAADRLEARAVYRAPSPAPSSFTPILMLYSGVIIIPMLQMRV